LKIRARSDTAWVLDELADLYDVTGAYGKAEPLLQRALAIREKEFGPERADTALVLDKLGWVYHATAAYEKAEALSQRAPDQRRRHSALSMRFCSLRFFGLPRERFLSLQLSRTSLPALP
jgi:hypothetical protein